MNRSKDIAHLGTQRADAASVALRAAVIGTIAGLSVFGALGVLARREGRSAAAPVNATSHVLHGAQAGTVDSIDTSHTGVGAVINYGASIFWALPFTWWLSRRRDRSAGQIALGAAATGTVAGVVDYGLVPRRLSPGWEHALPPRAVATTFGAMALGLAIGALVTRDAGRS
ncbi:hypothetical protein [Citreimonas salinaria]|uniref:Uncharacterized protein n=1 Tax=Citreimonas salinaria TaxID=321339 RepID=A0A1H3NFF1_9RHOB|nr:hypothetical protein [Citreimonas salinaria]SDY86909.1 hypothetical protein SAMN05444340_12310 [Citreimonas salinaria]